MKLIKLSVNGEMECEYSFDKINVILGDNNTGKSTFLKLILYCLGAPIKSFIDEISKMNMCESVSLELEFNNNKKIRVIRKLPVSDAIIVTPLKNTDEIVNDEINAFDSEEFSDYLLENEGYSIDKIIYSKDKTASFRFYFLLRALYVDQDTSAQRILSDLDMGHDYFTSQTTIKKSIIEKLLGKDNSELQRIRLEIQNLTKEHTKITERIKFLSNEINEIESNNIIDKKKISSELEKLKSEKELLSKCEYEKVLKVKSINAQQNSDFFIDKQHKLNDLYDSKRITALELKDIEDVIKSLNDDLVLLNYKTAAKDILETLPILYCPNCLSEISEKQIKKGLCENCGKKSVEEKVINSAMLKKTINDSISEANEVKLLKTNYLNSIDKEIATIESEIRQESKKIFDNNKQAVDVVYQTISEIKNRLEYILKRENLLIKYRKTENELSDLKDKRKNITVELNEFKDEMIKADTNATLSMMNFESFKNNFNRYLNYMFNEVSVCELDENYMPIIDKTKINSVSSASLKVAIRLSYVLGLFNESINTDANVNSHVGFLLLDSPKDKDLDNNRFEKFLGLVNRECYGQIIITGSISDEDLYKNNLTNAKFFNSLRTNDKLLKVKNNK